MAHEIISKYTQGQLKIVDFSYMFANREQIETEKALEVLIKSIHTKQVEELILNNNVFYPGYIPAFVALIRYSCHL